MRPNRRKAFTLLEILTVIAIITVLITLVTLGVGHMIRATRLTTPQVAMGNLKSLTSEKELVGGNLNDLNGFYGSTNWTQNGGKPPGQGNAPGGNRGPAGENPPLVETQTGA